MLGDSAGLSESGDRWSITLPTTGLDGLPVTIMVALALSVVIGAVLVRSMRLPAWRLMVWVAAVTLPTSATWTIPNGMANVPPVFGHCAIGRVPLPEMISRGLDVDIWTNILLTVPAGAAAVLWPWGSRRLAILLATLAGPVVIELVQLIPSLHRGCQLGDMINNMIGVVVGFLLATGAESLILAWRDAVRGRLVSPPTARHASPKAGSNRVPRL